MATRQVTVQFLGDAKKFSQSLDKMDGDTKKFSASLGKAAKIGAAGIAAGAAAIGATLFNVGREFEEVRKNIIAATGASGDALTALVNDTKAVMVQVPQSSAEVSSALAELNTRLGLTGKPLQDLSKQVLDFSRLTGSDATKSTQNITRVFGDWGVSTKDQAKTMDLLFTATKQSGIGLDRLTDLTVKYGAPLRNMGFGIEEGVALFSKWEKEGVNVETAFGGLRQAVGRFSKEGLDPAKGLQKGIELIKGAKTVGEATGKAIEVFGMRAGPDLADAIRGGKFDIEDYLKTLRDSEGSISAAADASLTFSERTGILKNKFKVLVEPTATKFLALLTKGMAYGAEEIANFADWLKQFKDEAIDVWTKVQNGFRRFIDFFRGGSRDGTKVMSDLQAKVSKLKEALLSAFDAIRLGIERTVSIATWIWKNFGANIVDFARDAWEYVSRTIDNALQAVRGIFDVFAGLFSGDWGRMWDGIKTILSAAWDQLKNMITFAFTGILDFIGGAAWTLLKKAWTLLWDGIKKLTGKLWEGIKDGVKLGFGVMVDWITGKTAWKLIKLAWTGIWNGLKDLLPKLWEGIKDGVSAGWDLLLDFLAGLPEDVAEGAKLLFVSLPKEAAKAAGQAADAIFDGLAGLNVKGVPLLPGISLGNKLLGRAAGGPITAGTPYLVGERGPELFVPSGSGQIVSNADLLGRGSSARGSSGGGTTVIQVVLDGRVLTETVYSGLLEKQRRTGRLGLAS